jgi:spermidine/putrescine transport system permease protein
MSAITGRVKSVFRAVREEPSFQGAFLISPTMLYLFLFLLLPLLLVVVLSVLTRGPYGNVVYRLNFKNYARLVDPLYLRILSYSFVTAMGTTLTAILIGYPLAYYIARSAARLRSILLFLILVPFWTNFIIRIYAWIMILRTEGLLNGMLLGLGVIQAPLDILYTPTAVFIGMVYEFLPFMVLPLFTSLEKIEMAWSSSRPWACSWCPI